MVGQVLFTDLAITTKEGTVAALSLAPLAVRPACQRQGIASALVQRGLELCRDECHRIVVVLGHPDFYRRVGFSSHSAAKLESPFSGRRSCMAAELVPGALEGMAGRVQHPPPFEGV